MVSVLSYCTVLLIVCFYLYFKRFISRLWFQSYNHNLYNTFTFTHFHIFFLKGQPMVDKHALRWWEQTKRPLKTLFDPYFKVIVVSLPFSPFLPFPFLFSSFVFFSLLLFPSLLLLSSSFSFSFSFSLHSLSPSLIWK